MVVFWLIVLFPLIAGLGYVLLAYVGKLLAWSEDFSNTHGFSIYAVFLLIPLGALWATTIEIAPNAATAALWDPEAIPDGVLIGGLGIVSGVLIYLLEWGYVRFRLWRRPLQLEEGLDAAPATASDQREESHLGFVLVTLFIVFAEELLWRGYLLSFLADGLSLSLGVSLVLASVAFGFNHFFFGFRNIVLKTLWGAAWGGLYLLTGSLWASMLSHGTFNMLALGIRIRWEK